MQLTSPLNKNMDEAEMPYRDELKGSTYTCTPADEGKERETASL